MGGGGGGGGVGGGGKGVERGELCTTPQQRHIHAHRQTLFRLPLYCIAVSTPLWLPRTALHRSARDSLARGEG